MNFFAHETWFTDMTSSDWSFAFEAATLAMLGLAVVVTLAVRLLAGRFPGVDFPFLGRMAPWIDGDEQLKLVAGRVWERWSELAPLRWLEVAPPPSDCGLTVGAHRER